jgi:hypothetical protein
LLIAEQNIAFLELADGVSSVEGRRMRHSGTTKGLNDGKKTASCFFGAANHEEAR